MSFDHLTNNRYKFKKWFDLNSHHNKKQQQNKLKMSRNYFSPLLLLLLLAYSNIQIDKYLYKLY